MPQPGNPGSLNRYSYVLNNPLKYTDPTGHAPTTPNCAGIPDCGVDGWYGYQEYAVRKYLDAERGRGAKQLANFLGNVAAVVFEPADYAMTLGACAAGDCSVLALGAMLLPGVPGAVGRYADETADAVKRLDAELIFKRGPDTDMNLTPRPGKDTGFDGGLSFFDAPENPNMQLQKGDKYLAVDAGKLNELQVIKDNNPPGHFTVRPASQDVLVEWAATRGTGIVHRLTEELRRAIRFTDKWR